MISDAQALVSGNLFGGKSENLPAQGGADTKVGGNSESLNQQETQPANPSN